MHGPTPPLPPRIPGRVYLPLPQLVGTLVIFSIPVMALFGVFGERWGTKTAATDSFEVTVQYPLRFRYKESDQIKVSVTNQTPTAVTAVVELSPSLLGAFTSVNFLPPIEKAYVVNLLNLAHGETGIIVIEIQAKRYGAHEGTVSVTAAGEEVQLGLNVFVFP